MKPECFDRSSRPLFVVLVGDESRLAPLRDKVKEHPAVQHVSLLDTSHYLWGAIRSGKVNTIIIDPMSMREPLEWTVDSIFHVRAEFPEIVFVLLIDGTGFETRLRSLPVEVQHRLAHYYRLDTSEIETGRRVDEVLAKCQHWLDSKANSRPNTRVYRYDVALSFAGEQRHMAEELADILTAQGVRVFYDRAHEAELWGKDLFAYLHEVYSKLSRYCIVFVSSSYITKMWTTHERRAAQERALKERDIEYLLPVRVDETSLPGLPDTIGYVESSRSMHEIAQLFIRKLGGHVGSLS